MGNVSFVFSETTLLTEPPGHANEASTGKQIKPEERGGEDKMEERRGKER